MSSTRRLSSFLAALVISAALFAPVAVQAARGTQEAPRLLNLWFTWQIPEDKLAELAKWDVVVLDQDQQARFPERIRKLRELNPKIKILAYASSSNIAAAQFVEESNFPGYQLAHAIPEAWYMHRGTLRVGFWPGAWLINVTNLAPKDSQGRRWNDFLPEYIQNTLWSSGLWDGVVLDEALPGATWFVGKGLDISGDGQAEPDDLVNREWQAGWKKLAQNVRSRLGPNALIMGNGSAVYAGVTNGILFEDFPRYGWASGFRDYQTSLRSNAKPALSAFNTNPNNVNDPANWKLMRFGLASALLEDGYYSFDYGNRDHGQTWWYDEYDATLGKPDGSSYIVRPSNASGIVEGVWWRDYERGAVAVNSLKTAEKVDLPGVYERLRGTQDTVTNSGRLETSVTLGPQEGIILYRRSSTAAIARSSAFVNGTFVRVYHADGAQARAGFFAQRSGVSGGSYVLLQDLDRDGKTDVASSLNGAVKIAFGNGQTRSFKPFGASYRGAISLAAGNMDRDGAWEIAAGRSNGSEVKIRNQRVASRRLARLCAELPRRRVGRGRRPGRRRQTRSHNRRRIERRASHPRLQDRRRGGAAASSPSTGWIAAACRSAGDLDGDGKDEIVAGSEGSAARAYLQFQREIKRIYHRLKVQLGRRHGERDRRGRRREDGIDDLRRRTDALTKNHANVQRFTNRRRAGLASHASMARLTGARLKFARAADFYAKYSGSTAIPR